MNIEFFIAKRLHFSKVKGKKEVSSPAIKIAIAGVAIGITTMLLAVAIVLGFQHEVRKKVIGFGGHLQIENYNNNVTYQKEPIILDDSLFLTLKNTEGVKNVEGVITREGIIKTADNFQGVIVKGVDQHHDWSFFEKSLVKGELPNINIQATDSTNNNYILISEVIANKLKLDVGDDFLAYFFQEKVQARKFKIKGIYNTNFDNYDKLYVFTDINTLQKLNKWDENQVSSIELLVNDFDNIDYIKDDLFITMLTYQKNEKSGLFTRSIKDLNPHIFNWLELLNTNIWVIIILMFSVSAFTMIAGLLIIILEQTNTIGILKALGMCNKKIRKTFIYISGFLILKGILIGNCIAITFIILQKTCHLITLDPKTYFVTAMPIEFNLFYFIIINIAVLIISVLTMVIPSYIISKISPVKAIRFE